MNNSSMWLTEAQDWNDDCLELLIDGSSSPIPPQKFETVIRNSDNFPISFPTNITRCKMLIYQTDQVVLERNINSAYPIIHENVLHLCAKFLLFKRKKGCRLERKLYKKLNLINFLDRLLNKKAVTFVKLYDSYILIDKSHGRGRGNWEMIGTYQELPPLILRNCLSYDELKLSAFISLSSYSYFINNGSRDNQGTMDEFRDDIQSEGIVVSIVGPRLVRHYVQDYCDVIIDKFQNSFFKVEEENISPTTRTLFSNFYDEPNFEYNDALMMYNEDSDRFVKIDNYLFDNAVYEKRMSVSFDTLLLEANHRAKERCMSAYLHVVGYGLGTWCISPHQKHLFVETFAKRLSVLGPKLHYISDIHFSHFPKNISCGNCKNGDIFQIEDHPTGIQIHISHREPHTRLSDEDKLLVVSYAADSNALPGNDFWKGCLGTSGDSTMASSSQIAELHNPHINPLISSRNLMVATCEGSLVSVQEYVVKMKSKLRRDFRRKWYRAMTFRKIVNFFLRMFRIRKD